MKKAILVWGFWFIVISLSSWAQEELTEPGESMPSEEQLVPFEKFAKTTKQALMRLDSTAFSPELGKIPEDTYLEVVQEKYDWYKIRIPEGSQAFVNSSYITIHSESEGISKASNLNIRSQNSLEAPIIGRLNKDQAIEIIETQGEWLRINPYPYSYAWVHKKSLKILSEQKEKPKATPSPEFLVSEIKTLEKILDAQLKSIKQEPLATGFLKKRGILFTNYGYRLENGNQIIFLKVKNTEEADKLLEQKVNVWGKFQNERNYLKVEDIKLIE